jgi:hypothetical protein
MRGAWVSAGFGVMVAVVFQNTRAWMWVEEEAEEL